MAIYHYINATGERIEARGSEIKRLAAEGTITPETIIVFPDGRKGLAKNVIGLTFSPNGTLPSGQAPTFACRALLLKKGDYSPSYLPKKIRQWFSEVGYNGELPKNREDLWKFYERFVKEQKPTGNQLHYLSEVGYTGEEPQTIYDAEVLIDELLDKEIFEDSLQELSQLGYEGKPPRTQKEADRIIDRLYRNMHR